MMFLKLIFIIYLFTQNVMCARREYNIAVLLEKPRLENVFRIAFNDFNQKNKDIQLNPLMVKVNPDDPFMALNNTCDVLKKGVVGIFGPTSSSNIEIVQSFCNFKELPHILTSGTGPLMIGTQINLHPQFKQLSKAYMDIISYLNWKEFTILYTNDENLEKLSNFIEIAKTAGIVVYIENLDLDSKNNRPILRELRKSSQTHFILDCVDAERLYDVLLQFQQIGMLNSNYNYFLTNLDIQIEDLEAFLYSGADIMGIKIVESLDNHEQNASVQLYDSYSLKQYKLKTQLNSDTALIDDAVQIFSNILKSIDVVQDSSLSCNSSKTWRYGFNFINKVKTTSYSGLTGNIQFDDHGQRKTFELLLYNLKDGALTEKVIWNMHTGISRLQNIGNAIKEDTNVQNNFVVSTTLVEPYTMLKESLHPLSGNDRYEGFAIDLIHEISELERFNYTFIIREDHQNGAFNHVTGKWTGMIDDLLEHVEKSQNSGSGVDEIYNSHFWYQLPTCIMFKKLRRNCKYRAMNIGIKADLAISDLTITHERMQAVDFTDPFMHLGISILSQKPVTAPPDVLQFAKPFTTDFLKVIGVTSLIVVLSLYLVGRMCQEEWQKTSFNSKYVVNQLTFSNSAWFVYGSLFKQNTQVKIRSIPGRIVAGSWWMFCFILYILYISSLFFHTLTNEHVTEEHFADVRSLVKMAKEGRIKYGAKKGGSTAWFFKTSNDPLYQEMYQYMEMHPENMVHTISHGVDLVESSNYAFFMESSTIEHITNRMCNLAMYGGQLNEKAYGIAARKGSSYLPAISRAILKLQTSGKLAALKKKWWEDKRGGNACGDEFNNEVRPLAGFEITGLIHILVFGLILATFCGILELSIYTYKLSKKLNITLFQAFKHEIKRRFTGGRIKRTVDPALLSRPISDHEENAVELS